MKSFKSLLLPLALIASGFVIAGEPVTASGTDDLLEFNAVQHGGKIDIIWRVAPTAHVKKFIVERSSDNVHYQEVFEISRKGNTPEFEEFFEVDYLPLSGTSYYRLREVKENGVIVYSPVVPVNMEYFNHGWHIIHEGDNNVNQGQVNYAELNGKEMLVVLRDMKGAEFFANVKFSVKEEKLGIEPIDSKINPGDYIVIGTSRDEVFSRLVTVK